MFKCGILNNVCIGVGLLDLFLKWVVDLLWMFFFIRLGINVICFFGSILLGI